MFQSNLNINDHVNMASQGEMITCEPKFHYKHQGPYWRIAHMKLVPPEMCFIVSTYDR